MSRIILFLVFQLSWICTLKANFEDDDLVPRKEGLVLRISQQQDFSQDALSQPINQQGLSAQVGYNFHPITLGFELINFPTYQTGNATLNTQSKLSVVSLFADITIHEDGPFRSEISFGTGVANAQVTSQLFDESETFQSGQLSYTAVGLALTYSLNEWIALRGQFMMQNSVLLNPQWSPTARFGLEFNFDLMN